MAANGKVGVLDEEVQGQREQLTGDYVVKAEELQDYEDGDGCHKVVSQLVKTAP